jgi:phosphoribosylaminoimidazolecarboxamide formyltransferase/IMP cyclohydrolase
MPRALLSVSNKHGIVDLGRGLIARGFTLVSTGGTSRVLGDAGLAVTSVSEVTGFPELMDGRVKTLHPGLHGGILARRDHPEDRAALARHGFDLIDVVVVNLYPFVEAASNPAAPLTALTEEIDIGGPSLLRAAAKNFRGVLVVVDPADYSRVLDELTAAPSLAFRFEMARKAFAHTAAYDAAIADTLASFDWRETDFVRRAEAHELSDSMTLRLAKIRDLRYGENPHQRAAWYIERQANSLGGGLGQAMLLQGKELSYTNLLDLDAAARLVLEFDEPAAAVIKHTNPCGVATGATLAEAYVQARDADSLSAFGSAVGVNRPIDAATAKAIVSARVDALIGPAVDEDAQAILARKPAMRVVVASFDATRADSIEWRSLLGAVLAQERDRTVEADGPWTADSLPEGFRVVTKRRPTTDEWAALRFAWRVCAHVKSNAVVFTDASRTRAIGAGQMSRVDAVRAAIMKAGPGALKGAAVASDAFFPFRDGLDEVGACGATAVVQPGGSVRDAEVIESADEHGIAMVFTGRRHFRH